MKINKCVVIILVFGLIAFIGCDRPNGDSVNIPQDEPSQEAEQRVLKSYKVPERLSRQIFGTIHGILGAHGTARLAPDGQLLVAAPKSFHDGIKDFLEQFEENFFAPSPSVEVNYWIVAGREAKTPAKLDEFNRIKPALETIQNNQGNMEFKLLDHVVLTSSNQDRPAQVGGAVVNISQMLSAYGDGSLSIQPNIDLLTAQGNILAIQTNIETRRGELVVLGQSSQVLVGDRPIFEPEKEDTKKYFERVNVYYIISADVKI